MSITKDTIIGDILDTAPQTAPLFLDIGMVLYDKYETTYITPEDEVLVRLGAKAPQKQ